jgi:hypothetical protein
VFLGAALYGRQFPEVLNGSLTYVPAVVILFILATYHYKRQRVEPMLLLVAAVVFVASLSFRSIDGVVCGVLSTGTHFLWHVFNAIFLHLIARAYLVNVTPEGA